MEQITHRTLEVNGIRLHIAEQGTGPVVLLLHGFPQLWYSWRHQISVLANAGYHVVAPDLRGYGETDAPADPSKYTIFHIVGDVVELIQALGEKQVYLVGHDWGATVAWHTVLFRPDLIKCVVAVTVGFFARDAKYSLLDVARAEAGDKVYMIEWQEPGKAEADLGRDVKETFWKFYASRSTKLFAASEGKSIMESIPVPKALPSWITEEEIQVYVDSFSKVGFTGGLNYYRNIQKSWELCSPWTNKGVTVPALILKGDEDLGIELVKGYLESPLWKEQVPDGEYKIFPGVGHFMPEEVPELLSETLLEYFKKH